MQKLKIWIKQILTLQTALVMYLLAFPFFCWIAVSQANGAGLVELFAAAGGILLWLLNQSPTKNSGKNGTVQ